MAYTWIPFNKELSQKLLQFRNDRQPLIDWIYSNVNAEYIKHLKDAPDGRRVADIDPFTVFAIINRGIAHDKRVEICQIFKTYLNVSASVPKDFDGIPVMNTRQSNFMAFADRRKDGDIERLWNVLTSAIRHQNRVLSFNSLLITVPPYESIRKYTIFLRHPTRHFPNTKMPCLSGFQKIGILRNVKTAEVRK